MNARLRQIVDRLEIHPDDEILEIGCGYGVAATLICERLVAGGGRGRLLAIDRSPKMIDAARQRNRTYIESGRAEFLVADLERLNPGPRRFDKILAVRVGLFRREPRRAEGLIRSWLVPSGKVLVEYDEPKGWSAGRWAEA